MSQIKDSYILLFLVDPEYRIWRHLLLTIVGSIITFNMVFIAYQDCISILGNHIYLICFSSLTLFGLAVYFNYRCLVPEFLLRERYLLYSIVLSLSVFLLLALLLLQEYWVRNTFALSHRVSSYTNPLILIDNLATFMMLTICFLGISAIVLFRQWVSRDKDVNWMEYEHLKSEINKLKGQITPGFLSDTLSNASELVKTDPQKTSEMLMQLGQLLRYQLYDCNRDKVLLRSEINFLDGFFRLEQLNKDGFEYEIRTDGNINHIFVSPLLFISLIQNMIKGSASLNLSFLLKEKSLLFRCESDSENTLVGHALYLIEKRLELEYPGQHTLTLKPGITELQINVAG